MPVFQQKIKKIEGKQIRNGITKGFIVDIEWQADYNSTTKYKHSPKSQMFFM